MTEKDFPVTAKVVQQFSALSPSSFGLYIGILCLCGYVLLIVVTVPALIKAPL